MALLIAATMPSLKIVIEPDATFTVTSVWVPLPSASSTLVSVIETVVAFLTNLKLPLSVWPATPSSTPMPSTEIFLVATRVSMPTMNEPANVTPGMSTVIVAAMFP